MKSTLRKRGDKGARLIIANDNNPNKNAQLEIHQCLFDINNITFYLVQGTVKLRYGTMN